ncbi:RecQ family ATP-dependent DNA helicase [Ureibacillus aquaedulcis]|uniref:ATP-dependent DNA helicase RecQ n=1 Tax=Ureibacillus aquaedulcis TaxID=3058421 RepID=A0ABT8GR49_9BACL|nr:ATP-dependent DNA helicase RecQ [Ureibacillus sp. BA0131]MDN4493890.1 ATP-dependent DNA helicase RecQ [Ureibacillus sp. BA0131]
MKLESVLNQFFGYSDFRPGQKEVIESVLKGQDVIALLPTGMGKSLCYQLPGYVFNQPVLIISPLLSLMQDQVDQMKQFKEKRVVALNSFLNPDQKRATIHNLHNYRFIFISPEMLLQEQVQHKLNSMQLSLIVVDEAHCISQWGFDFRPDYLRIGEVIAKEDRPPILALSATATEKVLGDIESYLKMKNTFKFIHSVDRPNIHLGKMLFQAREDKIDWMIDHVTQTAGPGIIYTTSRSKTESLSGRLLQSGIACAAYHGGMDPLDRQFIQQQFIDGTLEWIVATNAFGMGVHKQNVRQVIHESLPSNMANYMQEIGRAGRDGEDSLAILLYAEGDEELAKFIGIDDYPVDAHVDSYIGYRARKEQPASMIHNGEISETAFRVLDYWMQQLPPEGVKQQLTSMKYAKMRAVEEVMGLIDTNTCMREKLVHYFGQTLENRPNDCCQCCGIDYKNIILLRDNISRQSFHLNWEERIKKLLLGNS